jgi:Protein of unknown function (DUF1552)
MPKFRISRRDVLRGTGSIAIALPWLEAMSTDAQAQTSGVAKRFIAVYQPGGTVLNKWRPSGSETDFTLSPILRPLEALKSRIAVLDGIDMKSAVGGIHEGGMVAFLSGTPQSAQHSQYASGPSVDQVIAGIASAGKPRKSLEVAVRWATGKSHGNLHPINSLNFADDARFSPIPPRIDPVEIWDSLFKNLNPSDTTETANLLARKQSMLDFLDKRYVSLSQRLGAGDRVKLEEHLSQIRELENNLTAISGDNTGCVVPTVVDTSDYNPASGKNSSDNGSIKDTSSDAAIPKVGKYMMDMIVMALACDRTSVATLQWSDTEAKHTFPWLNLSEHHHFYQHDGGFKPAECEKICTWYSEQHAYLLSRLEAVAVGDKTLLDETVVYFGSELQDPPNHAKNNMPFMLAGNGGGLQTGRYLKYNNPSHNDLLLALLRLFGDTRPTFGDPRYCTEPLSNLV